MKKGIIFSLIFSILLNCMFIKDAFSYSSNIINDDFEGSALSDIWVKEMPNDTYSGSISNKYFKSGKSSLRIELQKSDINVCDSKRSEIHLDRENPLEEHTYIFNTLLPKEGDEDYGLDDQGSDIIAQWHNTPDTNEEWTSPPLSLHTFYGHYYIKRVWDDAEITTNSQMEQKGNFASYDLGSYEEDKGKWVEWKFHIKWGWLESQKPILEVYKNGVEVLNCNGLPNTTNDKIGVCMKLGIYKWNWAQKDDKSTLKKRVVYFDNVTVK